MTDDNPIDAGIAAAGIASLKPAMSEVANLRGPMSEVAALRGALEATSRLEEPLRGLNDVAQRDLKPSLGTIAMWIGIAFLLWSLSTAVGVVLGLRWSQKRVATA